MRKVVYISRGRIIADILEAVKSKNGESTKTNLMYKANLNYQQILSYVPSMVKAELLNESPTLNGRTKAIYGVTSKGERYLQESPFVLKTLGDVEKAMKNIKNSKK